MRDNFTNRQILRFKVFIFMRFGFNNADNITVFVSTIVCVANLVCELFHANGKAEYDSLSFMTLEKFTFIFIELFLLFDAMSVCPVRAFCVYQKLRSRTSSSTISATK